MTSEPATSLAETTDSLTKPSVLQRNQPKRETIYLTKLTYENREFHFAHETAIEVTWDGELWTYESKNFGIEGFETTRQKADLAFRQTFALCWDHFACEEDDSKLSKKAKQIKTTFKSLISTIRHIE
jgi:hypothetical protein